MLAALWAADKPLIPADVQASLKTGHAYNTVLTILSRLHDKGLVERERSGRAYAYRPLVDEAELAAGRMHAALQRGSDHAGVLQRFVDGLSSDDEQVLRKLVR